MNTRIVAIAVVLLVAPDVRAGIASKAIGEGVEYIMKKFGREAAKEFGEDAAKVLARKMETFATRYGERVTVEAAKKVGPRMFRLIEQVGEDGAPIALKLMARRGDEAVWVVARRNCFAMFVKYGDDAADALIRHREIAEPLIENYGAPMIRALNKVDGRNARRLAMLADEGVLAKVPQRDAVLETITRYGNGAADWVWRNKGAITTAGVVTAFVANPEPFIKGLVEIVDIGGEKVVKPVADGIARSLNWNLLLGIPLALIVGWIALKRLCRASPAPVAAPTATPSPDNPPRRDVSTGLQTSANTSVNDGGHRT